MNCLPGGLLLGLVLLAGAGPPTRVAPPVWFDLGHRLVARLAARRLTPEASAAVRELLGGQDLAEAALWADRIRGERRETSRLHYVNIPLGAASYDSARDCQGGCIISAIEEDRRILADGSASLLVRAEALRFLVHFIGDLHQPLHVADNNDRGGNETQLRFMGRGTNLHQVWDGELIEASGMDETHYLAHLEELMSRQDLADLARGSVVDWAMEGHRLAVDHAYPLPRKRSLDREYVESNLPVVDLALIRAGVRLAGVLNEALTNHRPDQTGAPLGAGVYSDREAAAHAGETALVVGTVVTVHRSRSGNLHLNFGADYPHQSFSGAVLNPKDPALRSLDRLVGRRLGIRGVIMLYHGQAQIVIDRADQIVTDLP